MKKKNTPRAAYTHRGIWYIKPDYEVFVSYNLKLENVRARNILQE